MLSIFTLLAVAASSATGLTVYNFNPKLGAPLATTTLTNAPREQLPDTFILCVSFKLKMLDGQGFFHLFGQDMSPWLTL